MFDDLSVEKPGVDLPLASLLAHRLNPAAEVGCEGVKVQFQAIAGEDVGPIRCQRFHQSMHDGMGHGLRARPDFQDRDELRAGVDGEPHPQQSQWQAFLRTNDLAQAPPDFTVVLDEVRRFLLPVLQTVSQGQMMPGAWRAPGPWTS